MGLSGRLGRIGLWGSILRAATEFHALSSYLIANKLCSSLWSHLCVANGYSILWIRWCPDDVVETRTFIL